MNTTSISLNFFLNNEISVKKGCNSIPFIDLRKRCCYNLAKDFNGLKEHDDD